MAGIGFDRTRLKVVADPTIKHNTHQISVHGKTGNISIKLENVPAPRIPKPRGSRVTARSRRLNSRNPRSVTGPDFFDLFNCAGRGRAFSEKTMNDPVMRIARASVERFGTETSVPADQPGADSLARMLEHRSHRRYAERPVAQSCCGSCLHARSRRRPRAICSRPTLCTSTTRRKRKTIADLIPDNPWVRTAPVFLIFCGDNRRTRQVAELRGKPFANDHLDAFMNSAVDAGIVLASFIHAAEAARLGCCPISSVRNHSQAVSDLLELPDWVFPLAGLCVGYPSETGMITSRLGLDVTVHTDRFDDSTIATKIDAYDRRRLARQQYQEPARRRPLRDRGALRLVRRQGAAICETGARGLWRVHSRQEIRPELKSCAC